MTKQLFSVIFACTIALGLSPALFGKADTLESLLAQARSRELNQPQYYDKTNTKTGITPQQLRDAMGTAHQAGQVGLRDALARAARRLKDFSSPFFTAVVIDERPFTKEEKNDVLWPVYVWAIENDDIDLFYSFIPFFATSEKRPYGEPLSAKEIAQKQGSARIPLGE